VSGEVIGRRSLLLAGAALPASVSAFAQCVTDMMTVDACLGGVRRTVPSGMTFERNFLTGSLGAGAVFTRASTGWYTNASGVLVSAATNAPRFDYDPVTLQLKGLLLEDTATNIWLQSADVSTWQVGSIGVAGPALTLNAFTAPDGTLTADRLDIPAVTTAGMLSGLFQSVGVAATSYAFSMWMRGVAGGERLWLYVTPDGVLYYRQSVTLTTGWRRYVVITPTLTAASWFFSIGVDLRDAGQSATLAQSIYVWAGQLETSYMSSYIPTTGGIVTRAADALSYPIASVPAFSATAGTLSHEYILEGVAVASVGAPVAFVGANANTDYIDADQFNGGTATAPNAHGAEVFAGGGSIGYGLFPADAPIPANVITRCATGWAVGALVLVAHNGIGTGSGSAAIGSVPTIVSLIIGGAFHSQPPVSQWARRIRYWPRQLSQAELIAVTS
jgi:hypothetical protein